MNSSTIYIVTGVIAGFLVIAALCALGLVVSLVVSM
jgi:hypothetical protein